MRRARRLVPAASDPATPRSSGGLLVTGSIGGGLVDVANAAFVVTRLGTVVALMVTPAHRYPFGTSAGCTVYGVPNVSFSAVFVAIVVPCTKRSVCARKSRSSTVFPCEKQAMRAAPRLEGAPPLTFPGELYLKHFALPNFFFHVTTAYAILNFLIHSQRDVVSLEAPVHWPLEGVRQLGGVTGQ